MLVGMLNLKQSACFNYVLVCIFSHNHVGMYQQMRPPRYLCSLRERLHRGRLVRLVHMV